MADLQGVLRFPGISQVRSWSYTLSHGITPGVASVEIVPQQGNLPDEPQTMSITFGNIELDFDGCIIDAARIERDPETGMIVSLAILDRRWAWKFGAISGIYNVKLKTGYIQLGTEKTPTELAGLLLDAMGESNYDLSGMSDLPRPEVNWVYANPADELDQLSSSVGCRVVLGLDGAVHILKDGEGNDLPNGAVRTVGVGVDPPSKPDSLTVVCGATRFESTFRLEAVGLESGSTNAIKTINNLSYKPTGTSGWGSEMYFSFGNITDNTNRQLAQRSVFRWFRIKCSAPNNTQGQFTIKGYDKTVSKLWQLLPIEDGRVTSYVDDDGIEVKIPAYLYGVWYNGGFDDANVSSNRPYTGSFSVDRERGIIMTSEPLTKLSNGTFSEPDLWLTIGHGVKDAQTRQEVRFTVERPLPGFPLGVGTQPLHRMDVVRTIVTNYDTNGNPTDTTDNLQQVQQECNYYLDAAEAGFQTVETGHAEYAGVVAISPDGAIQQVEWRGDEKGGCVTRASRNSEFSLVVPSYKDRRIDALYRVQPDPSKAIIAKVMGVLRAAADPQGRIIR